MKFLEFYQEEPGRYITHDGADYWLNPILRLADNAAVEEINVADLRWIITDPTEASAYADISKPILVTKWKGKLVVIDGYHRLLKSVKMGKNTIPAKMVDNRLLLYFEKQ